MKTVKPTTPIPLFFEGQTDRFFSMKDLNCEAEPYYNKNFFYFPDLCHVKAERNNDLDGVTVPGGGEGRKWNVYVTDNVVEDDHDRVRLCVIASKEPDSAGYNRTLIWMSDEEREQMQGYEGFEDWIILGEEDVLKLFLLLIPSTGKDLIAEDCL